MDRLTQAAVDATRGPGGAAAPASTLTMLNQRIDDIDDVSLNIQLSLRENARKTRAARARLTRELRKNPPSTTTTTVTAHSGPSGGAAAARGPNGPCRREAMRVLQLQRRGAELERALRTQDAVKGKLESAATAVEEARVRRAETVAVVAAARAVEATRPRNADTQRADALLTLHASSLVAQQDLAREEQAAATAAQAIEELELDLELAPGLAASSSSTTEAEIRAIIEQSQ